MRREVGLIALGALLAVALLGAGTALNLRTDGIQFADGSVQTSAAVDTTCDGQPCDGSYFTNVTAAAGPGLRVVDSLGQTIGPVLGFGADVSGGVLTYLELGTNNEIVWFALETYEYALVHTADIYFSEPDCTGIAYIGGGINTETDHFSHAVFAYGAPGVIFKSDNFGIDVEFVPGSRWGRRSRWTVGDLTDDCDNNPGDWVEITRKPAVVFADLKNLPYVPDFRLE